MPQPQVTELYKAFKQTLQSAISCFSRATLWSERSFATDQVFTFQLSDESTPLGRQPAFYLRFAHSCRIAQRADVWEVQTISYSYWLLDSRQNELLLYQWVTTDESKVTRPHLHIRALTKLTEANLSEEHLSTASKHLVNLLIRAHLPTGHISLTEILRMAIDDLRVEPLETDPLNVDRRLAAADDVLRASLAWQVRS